MTSCGKPPIELPIGEFPVDVEETPHAEPTPQDLSFQADERVKLIDTWAEENKEYRAWVEKKALALRDRPDKHYLTEGIYILEDENKLFYVNEQTGEKKLVLEGALHADYSSEVIEDFEIEGVYFGDKIDEHRFVYIIPVFEWYSACGIFDTSDFSEHPITISGETRTYRGIYGDYIYTVSGTYSKTDIHTNETTIIMPDIETDYNFFYNGNFSEDGKLFSYIKSDAGERKGIEFEVKVFDVESQALLASFEIKKTKVKLFWFAQFIDKNTIYFLEDGLVENVRYIIEVDINGIGQR